MTQRRIGFVAWLTGLPAAGKTTLANLVGELLSAEGRPVNVIDGDVFRQQTSTRLGYSAIDRARNVELIAHAAAAAAEAGESVLVAAIAPFAQLRLNARAIVEQVAPFYEIHVDAPLATCIDRDPKGHYRRALRGELPNFTGIGDAYERPENPDIRVDTTSVTPEAAAAHICAALMVSLRDPRRRTRLGQRQSASC